MSFEIEYNARSLPPAEVAKSFVPPMAHLNNLISRSHTLVLGPRGSGKTTLLKMLTVKALANWSHPEAKAICRQVKFNAAFIPADLAWGTQIGYGLEAERPDEYEAAFAIHTLRSLIYAMREAVELGRQSPPQHLQHLSVLMEPHQEAEFISLVADGLSVSPRLKSLLGLELALEKKLEEICRGDKDNSYSARSLVPKLRLLIGAFNGLTGDDERRWALLFDELEIAPVELQKLLLSGIRSLDQRLLFKVALAPFMANLGFNPTPVSAHPGHDYATVQLSYPNKSDAAAFTRELFERTLARVGFDEISLGELFARDHGTGLGRRENSNKRKNTLPNEFYSLAEKDESFKAYAENRGIFSPGYVRNDKNLAQDVRKVQPIVISRDYYLSSFKDGRASRQRSRKTYGLYAGWPSIAEITEGNPRAILTLLVPLVREYNSELARLRRKFSVPVSLQNHSIARVELLLTSLLRVIPLETTGFGRQKGLLNFIDRVGRNLENRLLLQNFSPEYIGSFVVDEAVSPAVVTAVGQALNAGALVHVPYPDSGPEALLRGLRGQRFRISYSLAPRFRLLLTLGDRVNLSSLIDTIDRSPTLFQHGEADDPERD